MSALTRFQARSNKLTLALAASILLLSAFVWEQQFGAPLLRQILAATSLPQLTEVCTSTGIKLVDVSAWSSSAVVSSAPNHFGMNADCGICPLLASAYLAMLLYVGVRISIPALLKTPTKI